MLNGGKFLTRLSLADLKELIKNKSPHHGLTPMVFFLALRVTIPFIHGLTPVVFWWGDKRPVIVRVELNHLYPEECVPEDEYHTVVAIGYKKDKILFLDPGLKGIHSDHEEHFVWSWYANNGGALYI